MDNLRLKFYRCHERVMKTFTLYVRAYCLDRGIKESSTSKMCQKLTHTHTRARAQAEEYFA